MPTNMSGLYAADGSTNITVVSGSTYTGLYAANGSYNVVKAPGNSYVGLQHPCGALWVTANTNATPTLPLPYNAPDGSWNVFQATGSGFNNAGQGIGKGTPVTVISGNLFFDPTSLFPSTGGWWDPSDIAHMWKDVAGTIPVTTIGDLVARIDDKSGNGNHLLQPTLGNRPVWSNLTTSFFLKFRNVSSTWMSASFTFVQPMTRVTAARQVIWTIGNRLWDGITVNGALIYQNGTSPQIGMYAGGTELDDNTHMTVGADHVVTEFWNGASSTLQVDNFTAISGSNPGTSAIGGATLASIGGGGGSFGDVNWYGAIHIGRALTPTETNNCRTFFGAKAGLVL